MNKQMFRKNLWTRVRLRRIAKRFNVDGAELKRIDDVWIFKTCSAKGDIEIENDGGYSFTLNSDHIYGWTSDPLSGEKHGLLRLMVQVNIGETKVWIEPNVRPVSN